MSRELPLLRYAWRPAVPIVPPALSVLTPQERRAALQT
jgi:hypothetical protein